MGVCFTPWGIRRSYFNGCFQIAVVNICRCNTCVDLRLPATGESFGYDRAYSLVANGQVVTDLLYEGYFAFEVEPGKVSLAADLKNTSGQQLRVGLLDFALRPDAAKMDIAKINKTPTF